MSTALPRAEDLPEIHWEDTRVQAQVQGSSVLSISCFARVRSAVNESILRPLAGPDAGLVSRRVFVRAAGAALGSAALGSIAEACGGGDGASGPEQPPAQTLGAIRGLVTDLQGTPQSSLGRLYLMRQTGQQTGRVAEVNAEGRFTCDNLEPRDYKVRFFAAARAHVP